MDEWIRRWALRLMILVVAAFILTVGWIVYDGLGDSSSTADCAVVLGEPMGTDGKPSPELAKRLDHVATLLQSGGLKSTVLAAEVAPGDAKTIEDGMNQYLTEHGAPAEKVMQDLHGPTPETMAANIAAYMGSAQLTSVQLVANYADITRNKKALHDAGIATVVSWHSGAPAVGDGVKVVESAFFLWKNIFEKNVAPGAKKLVAEAKSETQGLIDRTEQKGSDAAQKAAGVPLTESMETVAPLAGGKVVNATNIGEFQVPADWNEQDLAPFIGLVWAPPTEAFLTMAVLTKIHRVGSLASAAADLSPGLSKEEHWRYDQVSQTSFMTPEGQIGLRVVTKATNDTSAKAIVISKYLFAGEGDTKVALFCACPAADAPANQPLFDSIAKTVHMK